MKSKLLGITYSEFDNTVGPKLLYTYPLNVMSTARFEELSDYVIVGKHLCKKIITVKNDDIQYMNYSVNIDNPKYNRNSLLFSLGFMLAENICTEPFEPILKKLSLAFLALENESEFLFLESTKQKIQNILQRLFIDLTEKGETFINLDDSNILTAKIFVSPKQPLEIYDYNVPMLIYDRISQLNIPWDISLNYLLNRIDGINHIKKIASIIPPIDIDCVKRCLRTLLFYDCVMITDVVQFSNIYQLQNPIKKIISDNNIMIKIQHFCCVNLNFLPSITNVLKILLKFQPGKQLCQILISSGVELLVGIDIRRLIAIAQNCKILARLHEYPIHMFKQNNINIRNENNNKDSNDHHIFQQKTHNIESDSNTTSVLQNESVISPTTPSVIKNAKMNRRSELASTGHSENLKILNNASNLSNSNNSTSASNIYTANNSSNSSTSNNDRLNIDSFLCNLDGNICLDSICCTYNIQPVTILKSQKFHIIYK